MKKVIPNIIGVGQLQRQVATVIKLIQDREEAFIVSHNEPQAVMMSLARYQELMNLEEKRRDEEDDILNVVRAGDLEYKTGKTVKIRSLKSLL